MLRLQDLDVKGKKVLMRVDFNVPLNPDGKISDDTKIRETLPSIQYVLDHGGSLILMSHIGRPKEKDPKLSLKVCADRLKELINVPVLMAPDSIGSDVKAMASALRPGQILLLENLRFHPGEEHPDQDPLFAKQLSELGDLYVNDAFGTAHRNHSSSAVITRYFPGKAAAGLLVQKELSFLAPLFHSPKRPFYAIIGGSKISTKIGVLKSLASKVDALFIGGGMVFTFLKAKGVAIGDSLHEDAFIPDVKQFLATPDAARLIFPEDLLIADQFKNDAKTKIIPIDKGFSSPWQGLDIGPLTIQSWKEKLKQGATIFWNGPLGVFEFPNFAHGTDEIAKALSRIKNALTIVGGGDSIAAINAAGLSKEFSHLCTGGGSSLEYLEFGHLPGIDALSS